MVGFDRYYESCVVESKGSLSFRNVIITEKQILFTEHVPKSITKNIDFRNILDVKLVSILVCHVRNISFGDEQVCGLTQSAPASCVQCL